MQRQRNPSNGFRSNMYRNYNNRGGGYGRAHHQQTQPRRIDVFYEAGKLAADYLSAKGLLNPNNDKWQNSNNLNSEVFSRRRSLDDPRGDSSVILGVETVRSPVVELIRDIRSEGVVKGEDEAISGVGGDDERKSLLEDLEVENVEDMVVEEVKEVSAENVVVKDDVLDEVESDVMMDEVKEECVDETSVKEEVTDENVNVEENKKGDGSGDLLTFKVPTKTRSSVSLKGSKSDPVLICGDENNKVESEKASQEAEVKSEQVVNNEVKVTPVASDEDDMYKFGLGLHMRSLSFPQKSVSELEIKDGVPGYSRCSSEVLGRGEKRPMEMNDITEITKKQKDWVSGISVNPQIDNYFPISGSRGDQSPSQEKQLFPNSFKICDLNLMGGSEAHENHDTSSVIGFGQAKQEPVSVGFDLTMNNSCGIGDRHITRGADGKGVEVIDLDCDIQDDNNNTDQRDEAIFTDLESFPESMQRVNNMPEDGYGLMISELLDADIPNSSVSTGVNSMHNELSLHNEEEILGDDESIYMSLGEIPISFVPVWDQQPSQGYDKRY